MAISPDGNFVYVSFQTDNSIAIIDVATNTVAGTVNVGSSSFDVAFASVAVMLVAASLTVISVGRAAR